MTALREDILNKRLLSDIAMQFALILSKTTFLTPKKRTQIGDGGEGVKLIWAMPECKRFLEA